MALVFGTFPLLAQPVTQVAAGGFHSLFLKSDGSLWGMGSNGGGELGDGSYNNTNRPEMIVATNVVAIAAGDEHSLFVKSDGSLWAMGDDGYGQLGDGMNNGTNQPEEIVSSNVTAVAAGSFHSLFLKSDGSLWGMGNNGYGQLGDGTYNFQGTNLPEMIVASNVVAIAAGDAHSLFLKNDGSLWAMGWNQFGQLGDGTNIRTNHPEEIISSNVVAIALGCDSDHSLFLKSDGSLWAMGYNYYGQLGDGTLNSANQPEEIISSNVVVISAGYSHSLFVKSDGSLWAMGYDRYGQLGDGAYTTAYPYGTNQPEQIVVDGLKAIAAGGFHSLLLKAGGSLWAMGDNSIGQLGGGASFTKANRPVQILGPYNQIQTTGQLVGGTNMQLAFVGIANGNYALDRSAGLSPPNWIPQVTNQASSYGPMVFTNTPDATTNNFWRVRSVP